jgi:prepilin-type N-terminal cleavage/methylation domain-containing protein
VPRGQSLQNETFRASRVESAFSLIEILVSISVVSVLVTLVAVGLKGARRASRSLQCQIVARGCGQALATYTSSNTDSFPLFADAHADPPLRNGGVGVPYFAQEVLWPKALRGYFDHDYLTAATQCPSSPVSVEVLRDGNRESYLAQYGAGYVEPSSYWLSGTVFADPSFFRETAGDRPVHLLRRTFTHEVLFPSSKGIFVEPRAFHLGAAEFGRRIDDDFALYADRTGRTPYVVWFQDGHIATLRRPQMVEGVRVPSDADPTPVLRTADGLRGRDTR